MASAEQEIRRELDEERQHLVEDVQTLRTTARAKVPLVAAGAAGLIFVLSGGLKETVRLLLRRR